MNSSQPVTGEGLQATRLGHGREEVSMSIDVGAHISQLVISLDDPSLSDKDIKRITRKIDYLVDLKSKL